MVKDINRAKAIEDMRASRDILEGNIRLFHEGNESVYRVIATQLWLLLCDGENPLLERIFPIIKLHPLIGYISKEQDEEWKRKYGRSLKDGLVLQIPAMMNFNGKGGVKIVQLFDEQREPLELNEWLKQDLFNKDTTIYQLLKSVRHKVGAHSDVKYDKTLKFVKSIHIATEESHIRIIVKIGEYILRLLNELQV